MLFANISSKAQHKLTIILDSIPTSSESDSIFLSGSFNGWIPSDKDYLIIGKKATFILNDNSIEFKFTRGSWEKCECDMDGGSIDNRTLNIHTDTTLHTTIKAWKDGFATEVVKHTASEQVHIIDTAFLMPQLSRTRRIWIYLPKGYGENNKRYPVMYMQDGQNVFDAATSYSGEWGVDEFIDSTKLPPCIVVGIDHGGEHRLTEYNPYDNAKHGKGEGEKYIDFLIATLKPFVDTHYRTLKNKQNTIIAGSSMGGLISFFAAMKYPNIFGKAGVFSPSFWIGKSEIKNDLDLTEKNLQGDWYISIGAKEAENMMADAEEIAKILKENSRVKVKFVIDKDANHNEKAWQQQFPLFYKWIIEN